MSKFKVGDRIMAKLSGEYGKVILAGPDLYIISWNIYGDIESTMSKVDNGCVLDIEYVLDLKYKKQLGDILNETVNK